MALGRTVAVFEQLASELNFKINYKEAPDNLNGVMQKNGSWNGLIGGLMRREGDISAMSMEPTLQRATVVDFVHPYLVSPLNIIIQKQESRSLNVFAYLNSFEFIAWVVIGVYRFCHHCGTSGFFTVHIFSLRATICTESCLDCSISLLC